MKRRGRFCLDAFAWLAWMQDEPVQHRLEDAAGGYTGCVTSIEGKDGFEARGYQVQWLPRPKGMVAGARPRP